MRSFPQGPGTWWNTKNRCNEKKFANWKKSWKNVEIRKTIQRVNCKYRVIFEGQTENQSVYVGAFIWTVYDRAAAKPLLALNIRAAAWHILQLQRENGRVVGRGRRTESNEATKKSRGGRVLHCPRLDLEFFSVIWKESSLMQAKSVFIRVGAFTADKYWRNSNTLVPFRLSFPSTYILSWFLATGSFLFFFLKLTTGSFLFFRKKRSRMTRCLASEPGEQMGQSHHPALWEGGTGSSALLHLWSWLLPATFDIPKAAKFRRFVSHESRGE